MGRTFTSDGSDSDANSQGSSPRVAPTPGYSLENHDSRSNSPVHNSSQSPPHRSRSNSNSSHHSEASRPSARSHTKSPSNDRNSHSPNLQIDQGSNKSRSRSRSRSGSVRSKSRSHSRSPSGSRKSGSRSPSQKSNRSGSGSRKSGSPAASRHSRSRSRSGSRKSGSPATSRKSISASRSRSGSRSRSHSRSKSRSRSRSSSGSDAENKKKESRKRKVLSSESNASGDENVAKVKKVSAIIDSDSDEEVRGEGDTTPVADASQANELFGDADDITDSDDDNEEKKKPKKIISDDERDRDSDRERDRDSDRRRSTDDERASPYAEEREKSPEPEPIPETKIDVDIPRIATDLGKDMHFVKLPNFLSVETRPFDVETYEDEIDEEETLDEEGRQRLKLKVGNTIRWRNEIDKTGTALHESNARFVKWSDGSMSLHLGNEIFDVYKQPLQGDHNHLFIRQGTGLQGQAVFRTKLTFRPHSTESFTHKKMTMSLADRSQKTSGIKILTQVGHDPDADRYINLKREEEKLRQAMRVKHATKPKRSRDPGASHNLSYRDHDEGSEDEGGISIAAIKNKFKKGGAAAIGKQSASAIYSSDEEDGSDFETRRPKKIDRTKTSKALKDSDDDEDDESVASGGGDKSAEDANDDEEDSD